MNLFEIPLLMTGKWYKTESGASRVISYSELLREQQQRVLEGTGKEIRKSVEINLEEGIVLVNGTPIREMHHKKPLRPPLFLVLVCESLLGGKDASFFVKFVNACKSHKCPFPFIWIEDLRREKGPFRGGDAMKRKDDLCKIRSHLKSVLRDVVGFDILNLAVIPKAQITNHAETDKKLRDLLASFGIQ